MKKININYSELDNIQEMDDLHEIALDDLDNCYLELSDQELEDKLASELKELESQNEKDFVDLNKIYKNYSRFEYDSHLPRINDFNYDGKSVLYNGDSYDPLEVYGILEQKIIEAINERRADKEAYKQYQD